MSAHPLPAPLDAREVKSRADFVALASRYTSLRRSGRQYAGLCPFHRESNPSFYVHPEKKIFRCFGCGMGGDLFRFVMLIEGCDFLQALKIVAALDADGSFGEAPAAVRRILVRHAVKRETFAEAAVRIVSSLPPSGFLPSCSRCSTPMVFRSYRGNRFGGAYACGSCSLFFGPRELRQKLLAERGARCQWCRRDGCPVQMHHLWKAGNPFDPGSIVLLCSDCCGNALKLLAVHQVFTRRSRQGPERSEGPSLLIARLCEPRPLAVGELPSLACLAEAAYESERAGPGCFGAARSILTSTQRITFTRGTRGGGFDGHD